jgi:hypothetical protein
MTSDLQIQADTAVLYTAASREGAKVQPSIYMDLLLWN